MHQRKLSFLLAFLVAAGHLVAVPLARAADTPTHMPPNGGYGDGFDHTTELGQHLPNVPAGSTVTGVCFYLFGGSGGVTYEVRDEPNGDALFAGYVDGSGTTEWVCSTESFAWDSPGLFVFRSGGPGRVGYKDDVDDGHGYDCRTSVCIHQPTADRAYGVRVTEGEPPLLPGAPALPPSPVAHRQCWNGLVDGCFGVPAAAIEAGYSHTCFLLLTGNVGCDGEGAETANYTGGDARSLSITDGHTCILKTGGNVSCYGGGGAEDVEYRGGDAVEVAAGDGFSCLRLSDGDVRCYGPDWVHGYRLNGIALDAGTDHYCVVTTARDVVCAHRGGNLLRWGGSSALDVVVGGNLVCVLLTSRNVECYIEHFGWPTEGYEGRDAVAVSVGWAHACALLSNGDVRCWGWDYWGAVIQHLRGNALAVSAGMHHTCILLQAGEVECQTSVEHDDHNRVRLGRAEIVSDNTLHFGGVAAYHARLRAGVERDDLEKVRATTVDRLAASVDAARTGDLLPLLNEVFALQHGPPPVFDVLYGEDGAVRLQTGQGSMTPDCYGVENHNDLFARPLSICSPFLP